MSFGDLGDRLKQARAKKQQATQAPEKPFDPEEEARLKRRMVGVLIRDARVGAARTIDDCARLLNIPPDTIEAWEYGDAAPDLPQLELLAYYLNVHISHFWGDQTISQNRNSSTNTQNEYMQLRHRMIGALLRQAREEANLSLDEVAERTFIDVTTIEQYESAEKPIPMNELQALGNAVDKNVSYFLEGASYIGELLQIREEWKQFTDLDEEIRQFAANPLNLGFIKIAIMFSKMPTEQLRSIAAGLLDITM